MTLLPTDEVDRALAEGSAWRREGAELVRERRGRDFVDSMSFVTAVALLAQRADHHPDIDIRWNVVTLRLSTHSAGGLTDKDLSLSRAIDALDDPGIRDSADR